MPYPGGTYLFYQISFGHMRSLDLKSWFQFYNTLLVVHGTENIALVRITRV